MSKRRAKFLQSKVWKDFRQKILERDNHQCVLCGRTDKLNIHHILPRKGFQEFALTPDNCVSLCPSHHTFGHHSCHRGMGYIELIEWLRRNRPEQYNWIISHLSCC